MKHFLILSIFLSIFTLISGDSSCIKSETPLVSKCEGCPPKKDGKLCASTTRYFDLTKGACGCGTEPNPPDFWTKSKYTAALNCKNLDPENPTLSWCPQNCGTCYRLCTTGGTTQGTVPPMEDDCIVVQITNRCGDGFMEDYGPYWCGQELTYKECEANPDQCVRDKSTNMFGYSAHFDLQDVAGQITEKGWNNVEVTFEEVDCSMGDFGNWAQDCYCPQGK